MNKENESKKADACTLCGFCKYHCPVFRETKNESLSPRGRAILMNNNLLEKDIIFKCSICKACEKACPVKIDFHFTELRAKLVETGKETEANRKMIENIRKHGNPFGKIGKGKIPDKLYCC